MYRVAAMPAQFPIVHRDLRRALLRGFPYAVYFMSTNAEVVVFAVMHQAVDATRWQRRR